jgi:hypothetical protein
MKQTKIFAVLFLSVFFIGFGQQNKPGNAKSFLIRENAEMRISLETYKEIDGWMPLVISMEEIEFDLWINSAGEVTELWTGNNENFIPLFRIDLASNVIVFPAQKSSALAEQKNFCAFTVTESNPVRTRICVQGEESASALILDDREESAEFYLFSGRVPLTIFSAVIHNVSNSLSEVRFSGPSVRAFGTFLYDKNEEAIFMQRDGRPEPGMISAWAKRIK